MLGNERAFELAKKEIEYAHKKTKFFRRHMEDAGLTPTDIRSRGDFNRIPVSEKKHYRKNFPVGVLAEGYSLGTPGLLRAQSSGTTGERLVTMEVGWMYLQRAMDSLSVNPTISSVLTAHPRRHVRHAAPNCSDVECADPHSTMHDRILRDGTLVLSVYHDLLTTPDHVLARNVEEIAAYMPQMYYVDPTHLAFLFRYMSRQGHRPYEAPVLASYTLATQTSRRQIAEFLGARAPIVEAFSMSELGWLAVECPVGNVHLNTKSFFMELICDGRSAEPGELAELCVTTLDNGCTPYVRYRTGDLFRWIDLSCACGSQFPVVTVEGRLGNLVFRKNKIALTPRGLDDIVGAPNWLDIYKIQQVEPCEFVFSYVANEKFEDGMEEGISQGLSEALGNGMKLRVEKSDYIPAERSGKFLSFVAAANESQFERGLRL